MAGEVGKRALECILMYAMYATKNVRAQRDRLLQLRRLLPQRNPDEDGAAVVQEVASGLRKVYSDGLDYGARYLADGLEIAAEKGDRASFSTYAFNVIPDEQLYGALLEQWHPLRPATQAQAFARIEAAYYAAMLPMEHHLPRCVELLVGVRPDPVKRKPNGIMIGYSNDPVAAANEHMARILETGFPVPYPAATDMPPRAKSIVDLDQALSNLHRACSLTTLAVKHLDVAVAFISSLLDPEEVAKISKWTDKRVHISEDGPYPSDNSD